MVTTEWLKRDREAVLVDHRRNARGKTIVTPRRFGMREALERAERHGDLFEPVLAGGQALGRALKKSRY